MQTSSQRFRSIPLVSIRKTSSPWRLFTPGSWEIFILGSPWYLLVKINFKTYFYADTVFSAMQTLAMYRLKMSTVYEVTQTPFVGSFGYCILDHLDYSWLNPHPHLMFFFFFRAPFNHIPYVLKTAHFNSRLLLNG